MAEDQSLTIERVFDAPLEKVWQAWTEPEQIKKWWGPNDFTAPSIENDLRVGGKAIYAMRGPKGSEWDKVMYSGGIYKEVVPLKKIVVTDSFTDKDGNIIAGSEYGMPADFPRELLVTVTFADVGGKTKLMIKHEGFPAGQDYGAKAGWNESLDKFADSLKG
jgi:uncharacterized protein YndB with AHSA1/START domain